MREKPKATKPLPPALVAKLDQHSKWVLTEGQAGVRLELPKADLAGYDLSNRDLRKADLSEANLDEVDLSASNLCEAILSLASLRSADLFLADFTNADLSHAVLSYANLFGAKLVNARLQAAQLDGAQLATANLTDAKLFRANLSRANLNVAKLNGANLTEAVLSGAKLKDADLENASLFHVHGLRLDSSFIRGAHFSATKSVWWTALCNLLLPRLHRWLLRWVSRRLASYASAEPIRRDPWSVLRQTYAGPRAFYLFFFIVLFTIPYVGRAVFYTAVGPVEKHLVDWSEARRGELRKELGASPTPQAEVKKLTVKLPDEKVTVNIEGKPVTVVLPAREREVPLTVPDAKRAAAEKELAALDGATRKLKPRPVWQVVLRWDEGRVWPTTLAFLLIVYNALLYWLVTGAGPLRDDEERTGWSPAWADYRTLVHLHRVATVLFYVSVLSFLWNMAEMLGETVWVA